MLDHGPKNGGRDTVALLATGSEEESLTLTEGTDFVFLTLHSACFLLFSLFSVGLWHIAAFTLYVLGLVRDSLYSLDQA